jgi:hypothetical protein
MTIAFSTHIDKKPTHFVEKIWAGIIQEYKNITISDYEDYTIRHKERFNTPMSEYDQMMIDAKIHTFREDPNDRWKVGMKIHPVINNRTKNRFQFAPVVKCVSVQKIEITEMLMTQTAFCTVCNGKIFKVEIDGRTLHTKEVERLAKNDGFDSVEDFFSWFNKDFTGKIIHWTDLKY